MPTAWSSDGNAKAGDKPPPGAAYDSADMPYYMRLRDDGVGMHGGYIPGTGPASHGCIRLPHAFAELLFSNVSEGTRGRCRPVAADRPDIDSGAGQV